METAVADTASVVDAIVRKHNKSRASLIPILQDIQGALGFISPESLRVLERTTGISANESYGVATFYTQFRFSPPGKHVIHVCQGTACHVRGAGKILDALKADLGVAPGNATEDLQFTLETVACIGACGLAPVIMVDQDTHGRLTPDNIPAVLEKYKR